MFYPRLVSLALVASAISIILLVGPKSIPEKMDFWHHAAYLSVFASFLMIFAGLGGLIASFGLEVSGPGCFRVRSNMLGRALNKIGPPKEEVQISFCILSGICGFLLLLALMTLGVLYFLVFVFVPGFASITEKLPGVGLIVLKLLGIILALYVPALLAVKFRTYGLVFAGVVYSVLLAVAIQYGNPVTLKDGLGVAIGIGIAVGVLGGYYLLYRLVKLVPFYRKVCPVQAT